MKKSDFVLFVILGAIFWLSAALIIRFSGDTVFSENNPMLLLFYVLAIPLTFVFMFVTKWISKYELVNLLRPAVIMVFTATFLDAIALTWFRNLYSPSFEVALLGAAWILWGVGLGLLMAYYFDQKKLRKG